MTTLAEVMRAGGYRTGGFVSSFVMVRDFSGFEQGFDVYDDDVRTREAFRDNYERPAAKTVERALDWLAAGDPKAFLFVHLIEPHGPYTPPEPFLHDFALPAAGPLVPLDRVAAYQRIPGLRYVSEYVGRYDGEIAAADAQIGVLLDRLRELGWYDEATIVVVADHGESLGERGIWFLHGKTVDDAEAHVPLLVKFPASAGAALRGREIAAPVSVIDLFPTLLNAAGLPSAAKTGGADLRAVAEQGRRPGAPPATLLNVPGQLVVAAHGEGCAVWWRFAPPALRPGFVLADAALASVWPRLATDTRLPPDAPDRCQTDLTAAVAPLMVDLLSYRMPFSVVSRADAKDPAAKKHFIESR